MTVTTVNSGMPRGIMQPSRDVEDALPKTAQDEVAYWMDRKEDVERQLAKAIRSAEKKATARIAKLEDDLERQQNELRRERERRCPCLMCKLRRRFSSSERERS